MGGGTLERKKILKRRITELGIADSVIFCGIQKDVRPFYRAADVFTLTSSYGESFSVAALEAMAMGLPCVLTNVSGAREMIVEGVNGFLVKAGQPLDISNGWKRAFDFRGDFDPAVIRQRTIEKFNLEDCVHQYQEILERDI